MNHIAGLHAVLATLLFGAPALADNLADRIAELGGQPCAAGALTCVTIPSPIDPKTPGGPTIDIEYAVSLASVESRGVLFYVVGGPGGSGLAVADDYLAAYESGLTENMDVVFFDQRGIGSDHGLACPVAQARFDSAENSIAHPEAAIEQARSYAVDCQAELARPDLLPFAGTDHAIADLELFRQTIGSPKVWIFGESYGTQFAQSYATAYPDAVKGVILDGVVDLALDFDGYYASYVLASEQVLSDVLAGCATVSACRADMLGDAATVYDDLKARIDAGPVMVPFTLADGTVEQRPMTAAMLASAAFYALYGPQDRAAFLRALAAASRDDLVPLLQSAYAGLSIDPQALIGIDDPSWFGAAYYAVTCLDYAEGTDDGEQTARMIIDKAMQFAPKAPRLLSAYFVERLACAFWPARGENTRPAQYAGGDFPTLVLTSDADPITPASMAYSVFENASNAYLVTMQGGPHVIWGRDLACPDQIVYRALFDGVLPESTEQLCHQDFLGDYTPLTLTDPQQAADPFMLARAIETELAQSADIANWLGDEDLQAGCRHGGTMQGTYTDTDTIYTFSDCALWPGIVLQGTATDVDADLGQDGLTLEIGVSGSHFGRFTYRNNTDTGAASLSGDYDGLPVGTPRSAMP